jgi:mRNA deadenylase 3'-5' endonuclease subunit Ccr4
MASDSESECSELLTRKFSPGFTKNELRVAQMNVLADGLSGQRKDLGGFDGVTADTIKWSNRLPLIVREINRASPHILGLQEIDQIDSLMAILHDRYAHAFAPKTPSPCADPSMPDGCAILYDRRRFRRVQIPQETISLGENMSQNAAVVLLEDKNSPNKERFLVCSAHFKAKFGFEDVRFAQAQKLMNDLWKIQEWERIDELYPNIILCTDLNEGPDGNTYALLRTRYRSAMCLLGDGKEPEYTTIKKRSDRVSRFTSDYVLYDNTSYCSRENVKMTPIRHFEIPPVSAFDYLPNEKYPSDHFLICVGFRLVSRNTNREWMLKLKPKDTVSVLFEAGIDPSDVVSIDYAHRETSVHLKKNSEEFVHDLLCRNVIESYDPYERSDMHVRKLRKTSDENKKRWLEVAPSNSSAREEPDEYPPMSTEYFMEVISPIIRSGREEKKA